MATYFKMLDNQQGFGKRSLMLVSAAVLLFVIGGLYFFTNQKVIAPSQSGENAAISSQNDVIEQGTEATQEVTTLPPTTEIDTSTWKTYRNEEYGFEFQYPPELKPKSRGPSKGTIITATMPLSYDRVYFYSTTEFYPAYNTDKRERIKFDMIIFTNRRESISVDSFLEDGFFSAGSICDTKFLDPQNLQVTLRKFGKNIPVLEVVRVPDGLQSDIGCYYFKNTEGNLIVFNFIASQESKTMELLRDKILPTLVLNK